MSEQALKDAQLAQLQQENASLKIVSRNMSGTIGAQKQLLDEFMASNVHLRGSVLLLEDDVRNFSRQIEAFKERITVLEDEKRLLLKQNENPNLDDAA